MMCYPLEGRWWRPLRRVANAAVIHVDLAPNAGQEAAAWAWLDTKEQTRWRRFTHAGPRRRFALCRAALRAILCRKLHCTNEQLTFGSSSYGKPYAKVDNAPDPISFNVSHSASHGLIAVAPGGRLGVDVEERVDREDLADLTDSVLAPNEKDAFASLQRDHRTHFFFTLWTVKEALIKALGVGFSLDPSEFEAPVAIRRGLPTSTFRFPHLPHVQWRVDDLGTEKFAAAIARELPSESPLATQG